MASKCVVKPKNWGRRGWFFSMCKDQLLAFYSAVHLLYFLIYATWGWKWTVFFAPCNSRVRMLCWPYSAWLPAQQKILFWLLSSLFAFLFKFCSWIHWPDAMLGYMYASHLFGGVNQILYGFLGLGGWCCRTDTSGINFCWSERGFRWCLLAHCLLEWYFKSLNLERVS